MLLKTKWIFLGGKIKFARKPVNYSKNWRKRCSEECLFLSKIYSCTAPQKCFLVCSKYEVINYKYECYSNKLE